ncbi:MAG: helix-hairpin-helix domain-containing protein [Cyclobacteriaceae bacterium]
MNHLGFTRIEANGLVILIFITILIVGYQQLSARQGSTSTDPKTSLEKWYEEFEEEKKDAAAKNNQSYGSKNESIPFKYDFFEFDPNVSSESEFLRLGLSQHSANNILNYRKAGGKFRVKADLFKIYSIDSNRVVSLWEYIKLPENLPAKPKLIEREKIVKDINEVTAEELMEIRGIGPVLSERTIKFRDRLGGFYNLEQMLEVYGIQDTLMNQITASFTIKETNFNKMNINMLPADSLSNHPYISRRLAKTIVNYRNVHGKFLNPNDLGNIKSVSDSLMLKLLPYISVSD